MNLPKKILCLIIMAFLAAFITLRTPQLLFNVSEKSESNFPTSDHLADYRAYQEFTLDSLHNIKGELRDIVI